jgi:hypothetical protein
LRIDCLNVIGLATVAPGTGQDQVRFLTGTASGFGDEVVDFEKWTDYAL